MINLTTFAPEDFKEHLSVLENLICRLQEEE